MELEFKLLLNDNIESGSKKYAVKCIANSIDICPCCQTASGVSPIFNDARFKPATSSMSEHYILHSFYICPVCGNAYFAKYKTHEMYGDHLYFGNAIRVQPRKITNRSFSDDLVKLSPDFVAVYNEALQAEQQGLLKVCGAGYRKSFEYLLKDYLINQYKDKADQIADSQIYDIINDKSDEYNMPIKIVEISKRCAWLGNDHCHYRAKHTNADLEDLKDAIDILLYWIMAEFKTSDILKRFKKK